MRRPFGGHGGEGRSRLATLWIIMAWAAAAPPAFAADPIVGVTAGQVNRQDVPVRLAVPAGRLPGVTLDGPTSVVLRPIPDGKTVLGQLDRDDAGEIRLIFVAPSLPAGTVQRFALDVASIGREKGPWSFIESDRAIDLKHGDKLVFRYNRAPVSHPDYPSIQSRDAYIHPAYTPTGALITGDYSKFHPHHRGFFLAYARSIRGELKPDFWNIHAGSAKIHHDGADVVAAGPVTARLTTHHRWEAKGAEGPVLRERWDVEVYDIPGSPYWMFDLTSTQQAIGVPLELPPYRYGGMAYRGPEPFVKGALAVLTSEGHADRKAADQKPARWIDLTGPIADGSATYGGAVMFDHPSNVNHPTVVRIHPTTLPFFSFVPSHDAKVTIPADRPIVFRYRVVIHDGKPDRALDERLWYDFKTPPTVAFEDAPAR